MLSKEIKIHIIHQRIEVVWKNKVSIISAIPTLNNENTPSIFIQFFNYDIYLILLLKYN